jgi:hypothetical protein
LELVGGLATVAQSSMMIVHTSYFRCTIAIGNAFTTGWRVVLFLKRRRALRGVATGQV